MDTGMRLYPLTLKVDGHRCVVVGGGRVAERKVGSLLECGGDVVVVSPELTSGLETLEGGGEIEVVRRAFRPEDLEGALLVIAATDDRAVNQGVRAAAERYGVLANVVDVPDLCDFYVPASFTRGDLQIAVSTGGASPVLARRLREELEGQFGPEYGPYLELLGRLRWELQARVAERDKRAEAERAFVASPALSMLKQGKLDEAEKILNECVSRFAT